MGHFEHVREHELEVRRHMLVCALCVGVAIAVIVFAVVSIGWNAT